jgi:hypothetical protein
MSDLQDNKDIYKKLKDSKQNPPINELYKNIVIQKLSDINKNINEIAKQNTDPNKTDDVKCAEDCFTFLGVNPQSECEHGLKFFQCMDCSH